MPDIWSHGDMAEELVSALARLTGVEVYALIESAGGIERPSSDWDDFSVPVRRAHVRGLLKYMPGEVLSSLHDLLLDESLMDEPGTLPEPEPTPVTAPLLPSLVNPDGPVFVVHGHDELVEEQVKRLIEQATGRRAVVLHEQPSRGRTIIEQIERHSGASYAVILLTADDMGRAKGDAMERPRARQNVILELGYFMAALGRDRVTVLRQSNVEIPSDAAGILYQPIEGAWRMKLLREMEDAGIPVDYGKAPL